MLESMAYRLAQGSVLHDGNLPEHEKLAVLRVLFEREDLALFVEREKIEEKERGI